MEKKYLIISETENAFLAPTQKIKKLFGSSIVGYFPMNEISGSIMKDTINDKKCFYNGPTLGDVSSSFSGEVAPSFDGINDDVNIYDVISQVSLSTSGTIMGWTKISSPVWNDGIPRDILSIYALNGDNFVIRKPAIVGQLWNTNLYGGVSLITQIYISSTDWFCWAITWDKAQNVMRFLINGNIVFNDMTGLGNWSGGLYTDYCRLGDFGGAVTPFKGAMSNFIVLNRMITVAEHLSYAQIDKSLPSISYIGDSITVGGGWETWATLFSNTKGFISKNHAIQGVSISSHMISQASATFGDNSQYCIMALGTNDDNSGDMNLLQDKIKSGIDIVRTNNPNIIIYYMNVLPRWTDITGTTPVDKSNIRAAISSACASKGVTCYDSSSWLIAANTVDGIHPAYPAGHLGISSQLSSRI